MTKAEQTFETPDFIKRRNKEHAKSDVCDLISEYEKRFSDQITTEGLLMNDDELVKILQVCLEKSITFAQASGIDEIDYKNDEI